MAQGVVQQGPQVVEFGIVNPKWLDESRAEDTQSLIQQIVCYLDLRNYDNDTNNNQWKLPWSENPKVSANGDLKVDIVNRYTFTECISDDEIIKQLGLLQAIHDMSAKFNTNDIQNTSMSYIDTDKSRTIIGKFKSDDDDNDDNLFWWFCKFEFMKILDANNEIKYLNRGIASPEYLKQIINNGYAMFMLNNSSLYELNKSGREKVRALCKNWWKIWFNNKFEFESSYNITDDSLFKTLPGVRYSSVNKPLGFRENILQKLNGFMNENLYLNEVLVLNTNWTPNKNWGVIYKNESSIYSKLSITNLVNFLKETDLTFGLSSYSLTFGNCPSLKQYVNQLNRMQSIKPDGGLLERSLMLPAIYLQDQLTNNVFNPIADAVNTVESYIPIMGTIKEVSGYVPSISTVSNMTLHPWDTVSSFWKKSVPETAEQHDQDVDEPNILPTTSIESRGASKTTNFANVEESLEVAKGSGSFILGLTKQGSIILHDYHLYNQEKKSWEMVKLVLYEINGILFILFYDSKYNDLNNIALYNKLSKSLDVVYETYFEDLIVNQLDSIREDFQSDESDEFQYIIYDNEKYWTNVLNIPPDYDILNHQIPERISLLEKNLKINISSESTMLENYRIISLIQDKQLQTIIKDNLLQGWVINEKIIKLGKNQCCFFKRFNMHKWIIVVKQLDLVKSSNKNGFIFGEKVRKWLDWAEVDGYI